MSDQESIFADDWRNTLQAHYQDVVRRNDKHTEETLVTVLQELGFREDDLRQLKLEATMRADEMHDDFVPELDLDSPTAHSGVDLDAETEAPEQEPADEVDESDETAEDDNPDAPQQMSLF